MEKNTLHKKFCHLLFFLFIFSSILNHTKARENKKSSNCQVDHPYTICIGCVIDQSSGIGKEQQIAIQMAVNEFNQLSNCSKLSWYIKDLNGTSSRAASTDPSTYALRAYDATWAIVKAMEHSRGKMNSSELINRLSSSDFEGLSGKISFKNGKLMQKSTFRIISVNGKISTGGQTVPKERRLKIGVPELAAVKEFVSVRYDQEEMKPSFSGFSVEVFEAAAAKSLSHFPYDFFPFHGTYDEMLIAVYNKSLDAAVADISILDDRYDYADFSQPYMDSQVVMVVPAKNDLKWQRFIAVKAFQWKLWMALAASSLFTGAIIYFNEYVNDNPEFGNSFPQIIGSIIWFSVTLLSFAQRESIKNNLSRLVLAIWLFVILIVTVSYTVVLSSMVTVPRLQPSIGDVHYLQKTNATVGCNGVGFIPRYLMHTLKFKEENIERIGSISDYKEYFEQGKIAAAFFVGPHAKLFLANNCKSFAIANINLALGGFAFVFPKGSNFTADISRAVLNMKQTGEINQLEERILSFPSGSSCDQQIDDLSLYLSQGPLIVSSVISAIVLLIMVVRVIHKRWLIHDSIQSSLMSRRIFRWASFLLVELHARFGSGFFVAPIIQSQINLTSIASEN